MFCTFKIAGAIELGPLDEKWATLVGSGFPTSVVEGLNFTIGELCTVDDRQVNGVLLRKQEHNGDGKNDYGLNFVFGPFLVLRQVTRKCFTCLH